MDIKLIAMLIGSGFLYAVGAFCMRHTHPYAGSRSEPFEKKQRRRMIGIILITAATLLVGIVVLTLILISKNQI